MIRRIPVFYQTKHVHIEHGEIHLQVFVNLALRHLRVAIEVAKRLVDHVKHFTPILLFTKHLTALRVNRMQVVALLYQFGHLLVFLRHSVFGDDELILNIIIIFLPAAQLFHVLRIVGIVVDGSHRA